jgi:hypothetical protein
MKINTDASSETAIRWHGNTVTAIITGLGLSDRNINVVLIVHELSRKSGSTTEIPTTL